MRIKNMKKLQDVLAVGVLILVFVSIGKTQDLAEAINLALKNNPTINGQMEALNEAKLDAKSTFRSTLPQIGFDASYRHVTETAQVEFPTSGPQPNRINLGVFDTYEAGLTANYAIFTGFAQSNQIKLKKQQMQMTEQELEKSKKVIIFETIVKYRQVQNKLLEIETLKSAKKRVELQLNRIKSLVNQGMALSLDTLSLALTKLNYDQKIIAAQANYETTNQELTNLVGTNINVEKVILKNIETRLSEMNLDHNDDLTLLTVQRNMLLTGRSLTRSSYFPNIATYASLKYGKPGVDFIKNDWMTYGVWGIGLSWNLFKWNSDKLKLQSQEAGIKKVDFQYQAAREQIQTHYDNSVREFRSLQEQYNVLVSALKLAQTKMKIVDSQYKQGMSSTTDFNDANLELAEADINQKKQLLLMAIKINEIDYLSGKPINEWSIEL